MKKKKADSLSEIRPIPIAKLDDIQ